LSPYEVVVVSHTHWDREWYLPFQSYRYWLVKALDQLLDLLGKDPRYASFMFDGQAVVPGDYLEIRPERREEMLQYIRAKRALAGPWYDQPDEFLVSPEALVRNLLIGHRVAAKYGHVPKLGYVPDNFGHIAQLPQILKGFGIDNTFFHRGMGDEGETLKTEFLWEAPDGSQVLAVHMIQGYCNFARIPTDHDQALAYFEARLQELRRRASANVVLAMNGCDHLYPQPELPDVLDALNKAQGEWKAVHGSLQGYLEKVRASGVRFQVYRGELRSSRYHPLLPGVWSTRIPLKQENWRAQTILENYAEPISSFAMLEERPYPAAFLLTAWLYLLENHQHDVIYGCSVDDVYKGAEAHYVYIQQIAGMILEDELQALSGKVNIEPLPSASGYVVVFNTLNWPRTDLVRARLKLPKTARGLQVVDEQGNAAPVQVLSWEKDEAEVLFTVRGVPQLGFRAYAIREQEAGSPPASPLTADGNSVENEFFKVEADPEMGGALTVTDKRNGIVYRRLNLFQDGGDAGDEYDYSPPKTDAIANTASSKAGIALAEKGPARAVLSVETSLMLPASLTADRSERSREMREHRLTTRIALAAGVPRIDIETSFKNTAEDHRLRALFPTGVKADRCTADGHFHAVERSLTVPSGQGWVQKPVPTQPQLTWVDVADGTRGLTVANKGLPEYEVSAQPETEEKVLELTLLRAVGWLSRDDLLTRPYNAGPSIKTPGAQCQGNLTLEYSVIPHSGTWLSSGSYKEARGFNLPMRAVQTSRHGGALPSAASFLAVEPDSLIVTAVKKAEEDQTLILRFHNIASEVVQGSVWLRKPLRAAWRTNLNEEPQTRLTPDAEGRLTLAVQPHEIVTLKLMA